MATPETFLSAVASLHQRLTACFLRPETVQNLDTVRIDCARELKALATMLPVAELMIPSEIRVGARSELVSRLKVVVRCLVQPFANRAILTAVSVNPSLQNGSIGALGLAFMGVLYWLASASALPARHRQELLAFILTQEVFDPMVAALQPNLAQGPQQFSEAGDLLWRALESAGAGSAGGVAGPVLRNPNANHLAACLKISQKGEDVDKAAELLLMCHREWDAILLEHFPAGVAFPSSPILRLDANAAFVLRYMLLPPTLLSTVLVEQGVQQLARLVWSDGKADLCSKERVDSFSK
jgi:hypothetical protein